MRRFVRATLYGLPAAAAGSGIWYAITELTGYEIGLVAIVIGLMVGVAVRAGARRRGGWTYQGLAMTLTYLSIVSTYVPDILEEFFDEDDGVSVVEDISDREHGASGSADGDVVGEEGDATVADQEELNLVGGLIAFFVLAVVLLAIACAVPFLAGFDNILGLIIIGISLYEAWKLNKRVEIQINGPLRLQPAADQPANSHSENE